MIPPPAAAATGGATHERFAMAQLGTTVVSLRRLDTMNSQYRRRQQVGG